MRLRQWLVAALLLAPLPTRAAPAAVFVTLGTGGGPVIRVKRAQPANAVVVNGAIYLFDAGDGVQRQLVAAGLALRDVHAVFISHHHLDHNAGLAPLLVGRWLFNAATPLPVIGPPGTAALTAGLAAAYRPTELAPITIGGPPKPVIAATIAAQDMAATMDTPTLVYQDANIRVLAITNDHYHFAPGSPEAASRSYAFRIEAGRSFVFTGDTGPSPHVELLAKDCDVLVSEVIDIAAMRKTLDAATDIPAAARGPMLAHMQQDHLTPEQIGLLASRAGAREVVLTHLAPGLDSETGVAGYVMGVADHYHGPVRVARDLDRF